MTGLLFTVRALNDINNPQRKLSGDEYRHIYPELRSQLFNYIDVLKDCSKGEQLSRIESIESMLVARVLSFEQLQDIEVEAGPRVIEGVGAVDFMSGDDVSVSAGMEFPSGFYVYDNIVRSGFMAREQLDELMSLAEAYLEDQSSTRRSLSASISSKMATAAITLFITVVLVAGAGVFMFWRIEKSSRLRRSIETKLAESRQVYENIFDNNHAVMLVIDPESADIVDANESACKFYGYSRSELTKRKISEINTLSEAEVYNEMGRAKRGRSEHFEFRHKLKDGQFRDVEVYSGPVWLEGRRLLFSIIHDVTERREAYERASRHQAELIHLGRINMIAEMLSGLAHELNQPLCALTSTTKACVRMLENPVVDKKEIQDAMEQAYGQAHRAGDILKHIRKLMRKGDPDFNCEDLREVVSAAVEIFRLDRHQKDVKVSVYLPAEEVPVFMTAVQIEQVILNLLNNSVEAMDGQSVRNLDISVEKSYDSAVVRVADNGQGLKNKESLENLFEPFYTTKEGGLGMGLSINKSIIENHSGKIWANDMESGGAEFCFTLPIGKRGV
jgi:PAS domain S-box-containing protein